MFGYKCQECHRGTVREATRKDFEVKFDRIPFVVPEAVIGVCEACDAQYYHGREYKRWRKLFDEEQARTGGVLSPAEIRALREALGMTMSGFSALIGTTRQSLHHWEKDDREVPQSRMVDLVLRLLEEGVRQGMVDVVRFLYETALASGIELGAPKGLTRRQAGGGNGRRRGRLELADFKAYDAAYTEPRKQSPFSPCLHVLPPARAA